MAVVYASYSGEAIKESVVCESTELAVDERVEDGKSMPILIPEIILLYVIQQSFLYKLCDLMDVIILRYGSLVPRLSPLRRGRAWE